MLKFNLLSFSEGIHWRGPIQFTLFFYFPTGWIGPVLESEIRIRIEKNHYYHCKEELFLHVCHSVPATKVDTSMYFSGSNLKQGQFSTSYYYVYYKIIKKSSIPIACYLCRGAVGLYTEVSIFSFFSINSRFESPLVDRLVSWSTLLV